MLNTGVGHSASASYLLLVHLLHKFEIISNFASVVPTPHAPDAPSLILTCPILQLLSLVTNVPTTS